ncbi:hypothetical protein IHV12_19630 [Fictibacillus sp. 7GRE50]|uniref:hypothetical protein n=1 Tax=Fictibacillus sp. 7GRE50 TaxID=2745878 RepID=UPI0018CED4C8|nr:hypothetical protein [Fictibacillus sp. 7GRE50]MBH0167139.1 hypothetical protein [Fictibacillus sp. 7GRE50]
MQDTKDFQVMNFPNTDFKENDIKPSNYLIEMVDSKVFVIHREITRSELPDYENDRTFLFQNKYYLSCIKHTPSLSEAEKVVQRYWEAMKQLNRMKK